MKRKKIIIIAPMDSLHEHSVGTVDFHIERDPRPEEKEKGNEVSYLRPVQRVNFISP